MMNRILFQLVLAILFFPGAAFGAPQFGAAGTKVLGGAMSFEARSMTTTTPGVWFEDVGFDGHGEFGDVVAETSINSLSVGPDLTYFLGGGLAVRVGLVLTRTTGETETKTPAGDGSTEGLSVSYGGTFGVAYYIEAVDGKTWAFLGGEVGLARGKTEHTFGVAPRSNTVLSSTLVGGNAGFSFLVGNNGVIEVFARVARTDGELDEDHPTNDSETEDTAFGLGTRLGLVF